MDRAHIVSPPLPKNATEIRTIQREWGIERSYKTPNGPEICTSAPFNKRQALAAFIFVKAALTTSVTVLFDCLSKTHSVSQMILPHLHAREWLLQEFGHDRHVETQRSD